MFMGIMNDEPRLTATMTDRFFLKTYFFLQKNDTIDLKFDFVLKKNYKKKSFLKFQMALEFFPQIFDPSQIDILTQWIKGIILIYKWP